jgi:REP element-mobilizing transposase RayT
MASGRMHNRGGIHMITNRCEEGRFFLKPTKEVLDIITYWFARAMEKYGDGLEIYAFCFLCNHFHLLCRDNAGTLAKFMGYFQGNVARAINEHLGRSPAHFWQGHYDDQIIEGQRTFWKKYLYIIANTVKSGLVDRVARWEGFCSYKAALSGKPIVAVGVNRTRLHNANRGNKKREAKEFEERFEFSLATPPGMEEMTQKERAREIGRMVRKAERHYTDRRDRKPALGMENVLKVSSLHLPESLARSPKRRFACDSRQQEIERLKEYRQFIGAYKQVYAAFISSSLRGFRFHGEWPPGSLPPSASEPVFGEE